MRKEVSAEKLRTMTRSILPSTARKHARNAKARVKRRERRTVRQELHRHCDADFADETKFDLHRDVRLRWIVWGRRSADKLNHFMRWCDSLTRGMTKTQKLDSVRAILPKNLIGDHAFGHWESHCKRRRYWFLPIREEQRRHQQSSYDRTRHALRVALERDPCFLAELNAEIKRCKLEGEPRRMLHGMHDVDAFVRDITRYRDFNMEYGVLRSLKVVE